ncbi:hypothetical protein Tco_1571343 [Tanacetum coccineum]
MANLDFCDTHNIVAYLLKPEGSEDFHQIVDFINTIHIKYALTKNPTIHVLLIQQFWQTASASTSENGKMEIIATIDGKVKTVTEASISRHLKLEDSDGISTLPNTEIFKQLALMGPNLQGQESTVQSNSHHTTTSAPSTTQLLTLPPSMQITHVAEEAATLPHDSPLSRVHSLGSDEGSMTLHELMLIIKVKRLEKEVKLNKARRRAKIVVSDDEDAEKDTSKLERSMIEDIDQDAGVSLVQLMLRIRGGLKIRRRTVSTGSSGISTAEELVSTAGASMPLKQRQEIAGYEAAIRLQEQLDEEESKRIAKDAEVAQRLQEEIDASERQRMAQVHQAA